MKKPTTILRAGTRPSNLALTQTRTALNQIESMLDQIAFCTIPIASSGDRDRSTDLRNSPPDFFTHELDLALLNREIDLAVHSAKDLPNPPPSGISSFQLPWREDPRDALLLRPGSHLADLPPNPIIGVSSDRRATYCKNKFPNAIQKPIRGNIEERIAQIDSGAYDILIVAGAALIRLGLTHRITEWIPEQELAVPEAQGYLAITYRENDARLQALSALFPQSSQHSTILQGKRVLITCTEALQKKTTKEIITAGGIPVQLPLIQLKPRSNITLALKAYDWLVVTSPSSASILLDMTQKQRSELPLIMVCGKGTQAVFESHGVQVDAFPPKNFSAKALTEMASDRLSPGQNVLRVRSDLAGTALSAALQKTGAHVEDIVIADNHPIQHEKLPPFDIVFFASASAVKSFLNQWGREMLTEKTTLCMGEPTAQSLREATILPNVIATTSTTHAAIQTLLGFLISQQIHSQNEKGSD